MHPVNTVAHEAVLQASRRIDWRFLLPTPDLGQVACIGVTDADLLESLALFSVRLDVVDSTSGHGLVADTEHLCSGANGSYVLVAPANFVIQTKARNCCSIGVEVNPFCSGKIVAQIFWVGHFHASKQVDDHSHLLTLSRLCPA